MQKYYKAEMDRLLRITTRMVYPLFLLPFALLVFIWYKARFLPAPDYRPAPPGINKLLPPIILLFAALTALTAYLAKALAPKGYAINDVELVIARDRKPIKIPLRDILEVRRLEDGLLRRSLRLMGTSGFYGYYGLFWNRQLGRFRVYATRLTGLVAVKTEKTLYALSPDDPEDFVKNLCGLISR
jgi:type VI protein secretion system component VasK